MARNFQVSPMYFCKVDCLKRCGISENKKFLGTLDAKKEILTQRILPKFQTIIILFLGFMYECIK